MPRGVILLCFLRFLQIPEFYCCMIILRYHFSPPLLLCFKQHIPIHSPPTFQHLPLSPPLCTSSTSLLPDSLMRLRGNALWPPSWTWSLSLSVLPEELLERIGRWAYHMASLPRLSRHTHTHTQTVIAVRGERVLWRTPPSHPAEQISMREQTYAVKIILRLYMQ